MVIKSGAGTLNDWRDWSPPKRASHWKAGRSAMELARAWFTSRTPQIPVEIEQLLASHPATSGVIFVEGEAEFVTPLPERGEGRNHDLLLRGVIAEQKVVACVEAKADEPFGNETIGDYFRRKSVSSAPTRAPQRIQALTQLVFGAKASPLDPQIAPLRYQLLTAVAGTVLQARSENAFIALCLVHEFHTHQTQPQKIALNAVDFERFVQTLSGISSSIQPGQLYGPFPFGQTQLWLGKAIYKW